MGGALFPPYYLPGAKLTECGPLEKGMASHFSILALRTPVDVLSELSTMTHPSWVALHGMAHSFIELDEAVMIAFSVGFVRALTLLMCSLKE